MCSACEGREGREGKEGRDGREGREKGGTTQEETIVSNKSGEKVIKLLVSCMECLPDIELIWPELDTCSVQISSHLHSIIIQHRIAENIQ